MGLGLVLEISERKEMEVREGGQGCLLWFTGFLCLEGKRPSVENDGLYLDTELFRSFC